MSARSARIVQIGQESTWGTGVAATAKLMGVTDAHFAPVQQTAVRRHIGAATPSRYAVLGAASAEGGIDGDVSYEDVLYPLSAAFHAVTPSGTNPYTWTFSAPITPAGVIPDLFTIEYGPPDGSYRIAGAICTELTIRAEAGGIWEYQSSWLGRQMTTVSLASLADRAVNLVRMADTTLYIDAVGGTIGTTAITNALIGFELSINTARHLKLFNGVLPAGHGDGDWEISLRLTLEWTAAVKAIVDALAAATPAVQQRQIRLRASDSPRSLTIDGGFVLANNPDLYSDRDGNNTVELEWQAQYNAALGQALQVTVVNAVSALV